VNGVKRKLRTRILLALSALLISYIFYGLFQENYKSWDSQIIDRLFVLRTKVKPVKTHQPDAIVHIDANFYFSRPQHAQIIRNLAAMNVSAQLIDFVFTDRISGPDDQPLIDATLRFERLVKQFRFERLVKQSEKEHASTESGSHLHSDDSRWPINIKGRPQNFWSGTKPQAPYTALSSASRGVGFLNLTPDPDGIIRRLPLLVRYQNIIYPSLALRTLCDYLKVSPEQVIVTPGKSITLRDAQPVDGSGLVDINIPIDNSGNMILNIAQAWYGIPHYSYSKIFQSSENQANLAKLKKELAGKIAILSETVETMYQTRTTGQQKLLSSGVIHALVLQNILSGSFLRELGQYAAVLIEIGLLVLMIFLSVRFSSPAAVSGHDGPYRSISLPGRSVLFLWRRYFPIRATLVDHADRPGFSFDRPGD